MLNKETFYQQVHTTYPKAELPKALLQHDKVITKILESQYLEMNKDSVNKFIVSCSYIDDYYFDILNVDYKDVSLKVNLDLGKTKKLLNLKQTLSYGYLGLKLHLDNEESSDLKRYVFICKELCTKWRPYLWQNVESLLD